MKGLSLYTIVWVWLLVCGCSTKQQDKTPDLKSPKDTLVSLENDSFKLTISLLGGTFVNFERRSSGVNPFAWKQPEYALPDDHNAIPVLRGHYLCIGHWGKPTPGEQKQGMPANGEVPNNWWKLEGTQNNKVLGMNCEAPLEGLVISRKVFLSGTDPLFKVTETITNELPIARTTTVVQNLFFSLPFFDEDMILNSNATYGFNQERVLPNPQRQEYKWPHAYFDTLKISTNDLRQFSTKFRYVSSHIFSDTIGWITAWNPKLKLLLGYSWKTSDYPWLHIRNDIFYGKPSEHGIAFATTGLGEKYSMEDRLTTTFHTVKNFEPIDAKSSVTKTWYCFMINIPQQYEKTLGVSFRNDELILKIGISSGSKEYKLAL